MAETSHNTVAVIPARGGSKGIPNKNLRIVGGMSLIARAIETCREANTVQRVIVSTDDDAIADEAERHGAETVRRPSDISGDAAASESSILHALNHLNTTEGSMPDITVFVQCTAPLTRPEDLDGTVKELIDNGADTALAVTDFHYFLWQPNPENNAVGINHDKERRLLRQQRDPQYIETGSVYAMRTEGFFRAGHRFFGKTVMHVVPRERLLEIDDPEDLDIAEARIRQQFSPVALLPDPVSAVIFDFDGVFTDNKVIVDQQGNESVQCDRSDGWGLARLSDTGIRLVVLSSEKNGVVKVRCDKLGIESHQGLNSNKLPAMLDWCRREGLSPAHTVYVGNDDNDVPCLREAGCAIVPSDAYPAAKEAAHIVLECSGGTGAVREVCDMVLKKKGTCNEPTR